MSSETERENFEAWAETIGVTGMWLEREGDKYTFARTADAWLGWQARAAHPAEPPRTVTGDTAKMLLREIRNSGAVMGDSVQEAIDQLHGPGTYDRAVAQALKAQAAEAGETNDQEIQRLRAALADMTADRDSWESQASDRVDDALRFAEAGEALRKAAEAVEKWWIEEKIGEQLGGAPYCMFALRAALKGDSQGGE